MADKKKDDYEKPESHGEGDELEDVSGGSGQETLCKQGATAYSCVTGPDANMKSHDCLSGGDAVGYGTCKTGRGAMTGS